MQTHGHHHPGLRNRVLAVWSETASLRMPAVDAVTLEFENGGDTGLAAFSREGADAKGPAEPASSPLTLQLPCHQGLAGTWSNKDHPHAADKHPWA